MAVEAFGPASRATSNAGCFETGRVGSGPFQSGSVRW